jgi:hypothetical protein
MGTALLRLFADLLWRVSAAAEMRLAHRERASWGGSGWVKPSTYEGAPVTSLHFDEAPSPWKYDSWSVTDGDVVVLGIDGGYRPRGSR